MRKLLPLETIRRSHCVLCLAALLILAAGGVKAQTVFLNFNSVGQFNTNFNSWEDIGTGANGGNYSFAESANDGVGGSGGVAVLQNNDTTATYKSSSWNLSTNGASVLVSVLIHAQGPTSGVRMQLGVINSTTNGLNNNPGVAFESFRIVPVSATSWPVYEQYRTGNTTVSPGFLGIVTVTEGHWYKFVVSVTNTSGASGNVAAGCAFFDYGTSGLTPGANLISFSTAVSHAAQNIATNTTVWPAFRELADNGSAWDDFLACPGNSTPVFIQPLTNLTTLVDSLVTFTAMADGPGTISYTWYTNNVLVPGATSYNYTTPPLPVGFTNVTVVASNANGSSTNQATVMVIAPMSPLALTGFNRDMVIESNAVGLSYASYAQEFNSGQGTCYYQQGLPGTSYGLPGSRVFINGTDLTQFQFQPYTANNALVLSSESGVHNGTLTLVNPAVFSKIAILANSAAATATSVGQLTLHFADGSTYLTHYTAADWFSGSVAALQGVDSINISTGVTQGGPTSPSFFETTVNIAALAASGKTLTSLSFGEATGVGATAIYAVSGLVTGPNPFTLATVTNFSATQIQSVSALLAGGVVSTGGYVPTATIFYGPTDGGTNAAAWSNSVPLGYETGAFSQTVSNLSVGGTYYFSVQASNIAGLSWARPPQIFTTPTQTAARVTNLPPANITASSATLAADVLNTGGAPPVVTIFYGPTDGGTNATLWANSISLGLENSYASVTVPGLAAETTYYFTAQASNSQGVTWSAPSFSFTTSATNPASALVSMLTYHNDNARDGVNTNETQLTLANVNTNTFGRLFSYNVDGYVYAQPLIVTNVIIPGKGLHNVVYVATENDSVYAFDADSNEGPNANPLWQVSFLNPAAGVTTVPYANTGSDNIIPVIGITDTPVIDPATGTLYVEAKTMETSGSTTLYIHRLHALDITTGAERVSGAVSNSPSIIAATNYPGIGYGDGDGAGHVPWNGLREQSRPALTELNGVIYIAYASHGDNDYYHGWLFSYNAQSLAQLSVYNTTPNGGRGGIWQGGGGATVDEAGNFYYVTGNGNSGADFNATGASFSQATNNFAMSALKFTPSNGVPRLVDFFAPFNQAALTGGDQDLGSGAPLVLPDAAGSSRHPHLLVVAGKGGKIYLIDRDNMGHFNSSSDSQIVQVLTNVLGYGSYSTPAFFHGNLYYIGLNTPLMIFSVSNGLISTSPTSQTSTVFGTATDGLPGAPSISANGVSNAIVWVMQNDGYISDGPGILHAYNATNLAQELYNSSMLMARDNPGAAIQFTGPTVVNGKVYVGAQYELSVFGLGSFLPTPSIQPNGGFFTNQVRVGFSDGIAGASFYYTLDGTTPTTNSTLYTAPFIVANNVSVQVIAGAGGAVSGIASASFINSAAAGNGLGLVGAYYSNQLGTFVPPPTLVRTDAVINFNWTGAAPDPSISATNFCVRWTGCVQPQYTETYTFYTLSDAGVRLWINGQLLINAWSNQPPTQWSAALPMQAQQIYNIQMDYFYQNTGDSVAQLSWSSPSTPFAIIPQSQLYPVSNPPPVVVLTSPTNGAALTAAASVTLAAEAGAQSNALSQVAFYIDGQQIGTVTNLPYALTTTGLGAGSYVLTAVAVDGSGLSATSAPVNITVLAGAGLPYGLTNYPPAPAFYNMPPVFTGALPATLSLTGVFTNTPAMAPAASLIPYSPNVPLWSDGAQKVRYLSIPNTGAPYTPSSQISYAPTFTWSFPAGTVFVKTFELLTNQSDPTSLLRLETRLLVRDTNGAVYGVTYKWRSDHSDADLLTTNLTEAIPIQTPGGVMTNLWYYPSPSDCLQCHTAPANYVLGVNARQLNGSLTYPNGVTDNQLRALNRTGLLYPALDESQITNIEQLASLTNAAASYEQRARSYLDANCAQCHVQPGGSGPTFDARYDVALTNQHLLNTPALKGNFGYDNVNMITPDDVWRSSIYERMNSLDAAVKMPPLARNLIDTNAVQIMAAWINSLPGTPALPPPTLAPSGGTFEGFVNVTLEPPATNVTMYYTLDGSLPTTNSILYTGPFLLTHSAPVNANAWEAGYTNSVVGAAQFTILPGAFFTSPGGFTNGLFQMSFAAPLGSNYVLQVSTNLLQWFPLSTNTPLASPFVLTDPNAPGGTARFYRVLRQP